MKFVAGFVVGATAALLFETLLVFIVAALAAALAALALRAWWRMLDDCWPQSAPPTLWRPD